MPRRPIMRSIMSLAVTPAPSRPFQRIISVRGTRTQMPPVTATPSISVLPMPNM